MVQATYQVAGKRPLDRLVNKALKQLTQLGYSRRSLRRYHSIWRHLTEFSREGDFGDTFSADLAASFLAAYRIQEGEVLGPKAAWRLHAVYGIKILGDVPPRYRVTRGAGPRRRPWRRSASWSSWHARECRRCPQEGLRELRQVDPPGGD